jgi:alkylhydroperoxidase family enzyme
VDELRRIASSLGPTPPELEPYIAKVCERAYTITDADVESLKAAGISEDAIFEQTVRAAIVEGLRRFDAAAKAIG